MKPYTVQANIDQKVFHMGREVFYFKVVASLRQKKKKKDCYGGQSLDNNHVSKKSKTSVTLSSSVKHKL